MNRIAAAELHGVALFCGMTHDDIQSLLNAAEDVRYADGDVIFETGSEQRALYVLLEGCVEIDLQAPAFMETVLVRLDTKGVFGESSFFHNTPHAAKARCVGPVRVIRLKREKYDELLLAGSVPALRMGTNAADILAARLQATDHWIAGMLQDRQDHEVHASWQSFRSRMAHGFSAQTVGFQPR